MKTKTIAFKYFTNGRISIDPEAVNSGLVHGYVCKYQKKEALPAIEISFLKGSRQLCLSKGYNILEALKHCKAKTVLVNISIVKFTNDIFKRSFKQESYNIDRP